MKLLLYVVVSSHWGIYQTPTYSTRQNKINWFFIDSYRWGSDMIQMRYSYFSRVMLLKTMLLRISWERVENMAQCWIRIWMVSIFFFKYLLGTRIGLSCWCYKPHKPFKRMCKWTSHEDNSWIMCYIAMVLGDMRSLSWRLASLELFRLCKYNEYLHELIAKFCEKNPWKPPTPPWKATSIIRIAWWKIWHTEAEQHQNVYNARLMLAKLFVAVCLIKVN